MGDMMHLPCRTYASKGRPDVDVAWEAYLDKREVIFKRANRCWWERGSLTTRQAIDKIERLWSEYMAVVCAK